MKRIAAKIPLYKAFRRLGKPRIFPLNLTLNVTYRCPSRCQTCNIWKKEVDELTLAEWEKIFESIGRGKIYWLILSGGEPFLRKDLPELCSIAYKHLKPKVINIPTNGYLYQVVPEMVEKILANCPKSQIVINFSLDGIAEKHDKIRNLAGSFENFIKSYTALGKIKNPRLTIGIHTVISKLNFHEIPEIYSYVIENLKPDSYITEIAEQRVELDNFDLDVFPKYQEYESAIDFLLGKMKNQKTVGLSKITRSLRRQYYQLAKKIMRGKKQTIPCYAGFASAQISAEGEVWPCCVRADSMGKLREADYDFRKVWESPEAEKIRRSIKKQECFCPLASASYSNMLMHNPTLFKLLRNYFFT